MRPCASGQGRPPAAIDLPGISRRRDPDLKLSIIAVGRLARSPETELVRTYVERATNAGRVLGLGPVEVVEVESRKPGKAAEALALQPHLADAHVIACDEHGTARPSRAFAEEIAVLRDRGVRRRLVFLIGGADGLASSFWPKRTASSPLDRRPGRMRWRAPCWPNRFIGQ